MDFFPECLHTHISRSKFTDEQNINKQDTMLCSNFLAKINGKTRILLKTFHIC